MEPLGGPLILGILSEATLSLDLTTMLVSSGMLYPEGINRESFRSNHLLVFLIVHSFGLHLGWILSPGGQIPYEMALVIDIVKTTSQHFGVAVSWVLHTAHQD